MKNIIFLILLLFLTAVKCNFKNNILSDFKSEIYLIDTSILSRSLNFIDEIIIEENENLILNNISSADIDSKSNLLIITDPVNRTANLYDYKTGSIKGWLMAGLNFSDSVALSGKIPYKRYYLGNKTLRYLTNEDSKQYGISEKEIKTFLKNEFNIAKFINGKIYLLALIHVVAISEDDSLKMPENNTSIIICDYDLTIEKIIVLENRLSAHSGPDGFIINQKDNIIFATSVKSTRQRYEKKTDSLPSISMYNTNGDFIEISSYLPDNYNFKNAGYNLEHYPSLAQFNSEVFISFPYDLTIYKEKNIPRFKIKNLPFSNNPGFNYYKKISDDIINSDLNRDWNERYRIMNALFPIRILRIFEGNRNIIVQLLVMDTTIKNGYYYILQEYDFQGILISQTNIYEDVDSKIHFITIDNDNNILIIFRKNKDGWRMEKREWK
ncbi:MAG: hypothetical protein V1779_05430 [bacterium]